MWQKPLKTARFWCLRNVDALRAGLVVGFALRINAPKNAERKFDFCQTNCKKSGCLSSFRRRRTENTNGAGLEPVADNSESWPQQTIRQVHSLFFSTLRTSAKRLSIAKRSSKSLTNIRSWRILNFSYSFNACSLAASGVTAPGP